MKRFITIVPALLLAFSATAALQTGATAPNVAKSLEIVQTPSRSGAKASK